jgi:predicted DNA-binding protein
MIYMASADTTTIRVSTETRDRLNALSRRRAEPAGEVVAELVRAADEEELLTQMAAGFERLAANPTAREAYRSESEEIESAFEAPAPEW